MDGCSGAVNLTDLLGQGNRITVTAAADTAEKYGLPKGQRQAFRTRPDGNKELFVTLTGNPGVDAEEIDFYLEHEKDASIIFYLLEAPKVGLDLSQTQGDRDFVSEFLQSVEASRSLRDLPDAVFNLPQVQALTPAERDEIDPYLPDACYTYLTDTGIMPDVMTGEVVISDLAHWIHKETGKTPADEIIERAQIMALEAAGNPSGGDLLRELNAPGTVKAIFPQKHDVPNNRFANMLAQLVNEGEVDLKVRDKPAIYSTVEVTALDSDGVKLSRKLTEYERQVMEAFCTVWKYGHPDHIVTPNIIYRAMTHNPTANFSDKDRDDILAAVEVLTGTKAKIDMTQEVQFFKYDIEEPYIKGYILDLLEGGGIANGKRFVKWYIKGEPLVSQYATLAGNQRLTIPGEAYNVTYLEGNAPKPEDSWKPIHNSKDRIAIKGYMLRRIYQMRYDESRAKEDLRKYEYKRAQSKKKGIELEERPLASFRKEGRRISYSTVFEVTGLADKRNNSLSAHKQYMKCCLDYWKSCGYISNYHLVTGRSKGSVEAVDIFIQ